ncbi:hypothetical protein ACUWHX_000171 [Campylobacter upsaliensis]
MCYNFKKLAGSFSLTLIALISYLFLNAENLIFKGKIQSKTRQRREPLGRTGL